MDALAFKKLPFGKAGGSGKYRKRYGGQPGILFYFFNGLFAIHSGHVHIHDHQAGQLFFFKGCLEKVHCFPSIFCFRNIKGMTLGMDNIPDKKKVIFVVVNAKDGGNKGHDQNYR